MGLLSTVDHYASAGSRFLTGDKARRVNRLQNQFNLLYLGFFSVQLVASAGLGLYLLLFEPASFYPGLLFYALPPLASIAFLVYLFRAKQRNPGGMVRDLFYHGFIVAVVTVMCLLLGNNSAFWIFYLPHFVNTFLIFNISRRQAWIFSALTGVLMVPTVFFSASQGALLPLPSHITQLVSIIIIVLFSSLVAALGIAAWWRMKLTQRLVLLWDTASNFGVRFFHSEIDRKYRRIQNRVILLFAGLMAFLIACMLVILADIMTNTRHDPLPYVLHYGIVAPLELVILIGCLWFNSRYASVAGSVFAWITGLLHIGYLGISLQASTKFYLFNLALLPMPYIGFSPQVRAYRIANRFLSVAMLGMIMFSVWYLRHWPPLMPIPEILSLQVIQYLIPLALLGTYIVYFQYTWLQNAKTEEILELEKGKSDRLLLNILPDQVAQELKASGRSSPMLFRSATVIFTDFVGFTKIAEQLNPEELVSELDRCFSYFDAVCAKYGLEKLKTIGDAYMAAGGIPVPNNTHAIDCCLAALEIQAFMGQMAEIKAAQNLPYWQLRLGVNTGNLIAGVVGEKKFAYDVWGDTVNLASRMESSGVAGSINISRATYDQVRFLFQCRYRGKLQAKNKGEQDMFLLEGLRPRFSVDGEGRVPNAEFLEIYERIKRGGRLIARKDATIAHA